MVASLSFSDGPIWLAHLRAVDYESIVCPLAIAVKPSHSFHILHSALIILHSLLPLRGRWKLVTIATTRILRSQKIFALAGTNCSVALYFRP
jgi:hypothetical protein